MMEIVLIEKKNIAVMGNLVGSESEHKVCHGKYRKDNAI